MFKFSSPGGQQFLVLAVRKINLNIATRWHYRNSFVAIMKTYITQKVISINGMSSFSEYNLYLRCKGNISQSCFLIEIRELNCD